MSRGEGAPGHKPKRGHPVPHTLSICPRPALLRATLPPAGTILGGPQHPRTPSRVAPSPSCTQSTEQLPGKATPQRFRGSGSGFSHLPRQDFGCPREGCGKRRVPPAGFNPRDRQKASERLPTNQSLQISAAESMLHPQMQLPPQKKNQTAQHLLHRCRQKGARCPGPIAAATASVFDFLLIFFFTKLIFSPRYQQPGVAEEPRGLSKVPAPLCSLRISSSSLKPTADAGDTSPVCLWPRENHLRAFISGEKEGGKGKRLRDRSHGSSRPGARCTMSRGGAGAAVWL